LILTGTVEPGGLGAHAGDEPVAATGTQLFNGIGAWQSSGEFATLTLSTFFRGQSAAISTTGVAPATLCTSVYGAHDPMGLCNGFTGPI
jgi:hypothetical protein